MKLPSRARLLVVVSRVLVWAVAIGAPLALVWTLAGGLDGIIGRDTGVLRAAWSLGSIYGVEFGVVLLGLAYRDHVRLLDAKIDGPVRQTTLGNMQSYGLLLVMLLSQAIAGLASYGPLPVLSLFALVLCLGATIVLAVQLLVVRQRVKAAYLISRSRRAQRKPEAKE